MTWLTYDLSVPWWSSDRFLTFRLCDGVKSCVVYLPEFTVRGDIGWAARLELVRFTLARITLSEDSVICTISHSVGCLVFRKG